MVRSTRNVRLEPCGCRKPSFETAASRPPQDEGGSCCSHRLHLDLALRRKNCTLAGRAFLEQSTCHPRSCLPTPTTVQPREDAALEEDARLREDIRLLGRILGDTVREQEGAEVFDLVERIRQTSCASIATTTSRRGASWKTSSTACRSAETVRIVRAFSYFSHLANIAEDQNHIRQMPRAQTPAGAAPGHAGADAIARARGRHQRRRAARVLRQRAGQPGADRAPDRSAPQEHHRPRDGDRRTAGPARARPADAGGDSRRTTSSCAARC